jgi:phosphoribosylformylglycinamidine cyclo-ligase
MVDANAWTLPPLFAWLQAGGAIEPEELARTFNCGIGMAVVVSTEDVEAVTAALTEAGETVHRIGRIDEGPRGCTVRGSVETWSARAEWSATHKHG